ncbi:MAG TPA: class I SAM-dependent methyltransferase [Pilimelia sp.]|nr:class I SAM-dependent methyltransferase [Pilimelia sp.]
MTESLARARAAGFTMSSEPGVGELLATLACAVRPGGRVLEIGTGAGAGLAWVVAGLGSRTDVDVHSVEVDPAVAEVAAAGAWPPFVRLHTGDVLGLYDRLGAFDLIFADAPGGKWTGLDSTVAALAPGGLLLVDDMTPPRWGDPEHEENTGRVRATLLADPRLVAVEMRWSSGVILCARRW